MHPSDRHRRVLVIDDNPAIHADVRKILTPPANPEAAALEDLESQILGWSAPAAAPKTHFAIDSAYQGKDGLDLVTKAVAEGHPYSLAFVDVRMPPGWDGIETTLELWKVAPELQIVICTAYSDYSWDEMLGKLGASDRLLILKKPFDTIEVLQLANALTQKWNLEREAKAQAAELETRVKARTSELEASNLALKDEVERRAKIENDLKRAKDAAERADKAKSAFLANMSHEVRTPMNGIIGMANVLLSSPLDRDQRDYVLTLNKSCETLLGIINDVLDFSKIEAGGLTLEHVDFDLNETLELALDLQSEVATKKGLELVMEIDPAVPRCVRGDPLRLRQIFLNLIGNALKFTAQGEVAIKVSLLGQTEKVVSLRCEIVDTGIGIAPHILGELFKPFAQADVSTTRKYGGTGLGLAICKRLVELMHGEIGVVSEPDGGSTFWFTADLGKATEAAQGTAAQPISLAGRRALVVDDNATNRKLMAHLLTHWGLEHGSVESGPAAVAELRRAKAAGSPYEVAILDYHMPDMDGLGLAAAVRSDPTTGLPLMILLTSSGERLNPTAMGSHGLSACELKPIHQEKLRATLGAVLSRVRKPQSDERAPAMPTEYVRGGAEILVAEDNPVNQKVAVLQLRQLGYEADVVSNGRDVLAALRRKSYSLILMDAQMPEMDGIEATRRIREFQAAGERGFPKNLTIIAMTANAMSSDRVACIAAGMDDYLSKPVRPDQLKAMLQRHLKRAVPPVAAAAP